MKVVKVGNKYAVRSGNWLIGYRYQDLEDFKFQWRRHKDAFYKYCLGDLETIKEKFPTAYHDYIEKQEKAELKELRKTLAKKNSPIKLPVTYDWVNHRILDADMNFVCSIGNPSIFDNEWNLEEMEDIAEYLVKLINFNG